METTSCHNWCLGQAKLSFHSLALCDLQNTKVQGAISHLFEGHTVNFVECINVDYKSNRKESYMDLQLDVKGCKNVHDSFVKYTEVEMLDGQNQYKAEGHGLQVSRVISLQGWSPYIAALPACGLTACADRLLSERSKAGCLPACLPSQSTLRQSAQSLQ